MLSLLFIHAVYKPSFNIYADYIIIHVSVLCKSKFFP